MRIEQPDPIATARRLARDLVRSGFETRDSIVASVSECIEEDKEEFGEPVDIQSLVESSVDQEIQDLVIEQDAWDRPTDCDRLDSAFEQLKSSGILAQHHYTCCGTCGNFELPLHIQYESTLDRKWRGYAFYHVQDTESAIYGSGQCLSFGSVAQGEKESVAIGHEITNALREHGFEVKWNGSIEQRISFQMEWKMPWPPRVPDIIPDAALEMYKASQSKKNKPQGFLARIRNIFGKGK
jgi:Domain of unknown function (DUF6891)